MLPVRDLNDTIQHNLSQCTDNLELEFNKCAQSLFPANITLLSSCQLKSNDSSTSNGIPSPASPSNMTLESSFSSINGGGASTLPNPFGQAGGATTSALLKILYNEENRVALGELSYLEVLKRMRQSLTSAENRMISTCAPFTKY